MATTYSVEQLKQVLVDVRQAGKDLEQDLGLAYLSDDMAYETAQLILDDDVVLNQQLTKQYGIKDTVGWLADYVSGNGTGACYKLQIN
jgi:hypothetical protein